MSSSHIIPLTKDTLRSRFRFILNSYLQHRPIFQRAFTAAFAIYCLTSTYGSLTGRGIKGAPGGKGNGRRVKGLFMPIEAAVTNAYTEKQASSMALPGPSKTPYSIFV